MRSPPAPPDIVISTSNPGKLREIREILAALPRTLRPLQEFPEVALPTEGDEYEANAVAKARTVAVALQRPAFADDSGLEVDALGGAPGPGSARYGGPSLDDAGRVQRLLAELADVAPEARGACFVCIAAYALPGGEVVTARGECRGRILTTPRGRGGFGYDPIFQPDGEACSMAELAPARKNGISHRARAFHTLATQLPD